MKSERKLASERKPAQRNNPRAITNEATTTSTHVIDGDKTRHRDAISASIPRPAIHQKMIPMNGQLIDRQNPGNMPFGTKSLRANPRRLQGIFSSAGVDIRVIDIVSARLSRGVSGRGATFNLSTGCSTFLGQ
jgi:hypothetical protein